jgi:hypothetical protein
MKMKFIVLAWTAVIGLHQSQAAPPSGETPVPVPLSEKTLDFGKLKAWGIRTYSMTWKKGSADERKVGQMTFSCETKDGIVKLSNVTRQYLPDGQRFVESRGESVHPETNLFVTRSLSLHAGRSDGVPLFDQKVTIQDGTATIVTDAQGQSSTTKAKWPDKAVVDIAMFYLVTLLPPEAGRRYLLRDYVSTSSLQQPRPSIVECAGPDRSTGTPGKPWTLFLLYEPELQAKAVRYWVSQDGILSRVQLNSENRLDLVDPTMPLVR